MGRTLGNLPVSHLLMVVLLLLLVFITIVVDTGKVRHHSTGKQGFKHYKNYGIGGGVGNHVRRNVSMLSTLPATTSNSGLWPSVFNLATKAVITANATCGESRREEFCRMVDGGKGRCGICDNFSSDPGKRHPITYAIDGTNKWWQSPALFYGPQYEYVTITIDLKQVYQVAYVIIKAANSPRPGTWILERSLDNKHYEPWQYFARSDKECAERFGVRTTKGKPHYFTDTEVICTSFYSRLTPMENGEIHTSLIHGRPGANETSPELLEFTKARYVRLKLMGLRATVEPLPKWFSQDISKEKRLYYTIRDISIGGQCVCHGHAQSCRYNVASGHPECECSHHACGPNCEKCCPMYNQRKWGPGTSRDARQCLPCNCHGHATSCHYDEDVDRTGLSMDIHGNYQGGGVCDNCTKYTTGINCEKCKTGYYRPYGTLPDSEQPCMKCDCNTVGSLGTCIQDGEMASTCHCLPGYTGLKCNSCAKGYRGYPKCEACPCDQKGVVEIDDCEGDCICKVNVDGQNCSQCKLGYFGLHSDNPEGCLPCYCSQVTTVCESAIIIPQKIQTLKGWLITDLNVSEVAKPAWDDKGIFSIGNYELPDVESLYWLAPQPYLGNKLEFYSSIFTYKVQWVIMRGDTSGKPTIGPNIVLIGENGLRIAYGNDFYIGSNMTFSIKLNENDFYHIPPKIHDIVTRLEQMDYRGELVTRQQFLSVLTNIKYILLRATFHTDQIEALLEEAILDNNNQSTVESSSSNVEKCSCPSGYSGLSCESCSYGYVRIVANLSDHPDSVQSFCGKCDCNGHSETCNPDTGECFCQHNTIGETCERCAPGYYGNPLRGTPDDCKKCACPLENDENNFSPSCQIDYFTVTEGYVCTQCPRGFTGDHCEICDYGYFGNPLEISNSCQPCDCNGGPCDRLTGQCLSCKGNTEGWKCDKCKSGHYGDPLTANCRSCQCDPIGAISIDCDNETGQCLCKERFTGRTCDKCEIGYGNVTALCTPCTCNRIGSKSDICDPHTGLCDCQIGVEGFHCDACQNLHYGFSETGCKACNCDPIGSQFPTCELTTGQCICKPNYIGAKCDRCEDGYWKDNSICRPCNCNVNGSLGISCDQNNGQCYCKSGVGGIDCSSCLPNYYGNIDNGCKECEPCNKAGHICDPETGRCVCPPMTIGRKCEKCAKNTWGYEPGIGCKACDCSSTGSSKTQCDRITGRCLCRLGFEGEKCDRCSFGYYGYKYCRKCNCNRAGTLPEDCTHDTCRCNEDGCRCKANVIGKYCDRCKDGSFGVDIDNPSGCTDCFCFGRSKICKSAGYTWDQIRTDEVKHVVCANQATCWQLPSKFLGDLTTSYGGYLRISSNSPITTNYRVYLTGNGIVLESLSNEADIRIHENYWRIIRDSLIPSKLPNDCFYSLTRPCLLVILQNVTNIEIEPGPTYKITEFNEILLDKATDIFGVPHAISVENCECPVEYTSLSCQDPNTGYYRYIPMDDETDNYIDKIIGISRRCHCNDRSNNCDPQTGYCLNCTKHTTGPHCEYCADGYYKDSFGECLPCPCPTERQNFAKSCKPAIKFDYFKCICRDGYAGAKCDRCDDGYYGNPGELDGLCQACNCNPYGSESPICDKSTGICQCKSGFTGKQCSDCISPRQVIQNGICTPCDECTQILFNTIDELWIGLNGTLELFKNGIGPPWGILNQTLIHYHLLSTKFDDNIVRAYRLIENADLPKLERRLHHIERNLNKTDKELIRQSKSINNIAKQAKNLNNEIIELNATILATIKNLNDFGKSHIDVGEALREAKQILNNIELLTKQIPSEKNYRDLFEQCWKLLDKIETIYGSDLDPNNLRDDLNGLKKRLSSMNMLLDQTESMNKLIKNKNKQHTNRIEYLKRITKEIDDKNFIINQEFNDLINRINATGDILMEIEWIYRNLSGIEIDKSIGKIEKDTEDISEMFNLLTQVGEHVKDLQNKIKTYKSLFNFTKDEWKKIDASGAYENLVKGIEDAKRKADDAKKLLEDGLKLLYPDDDDSLADKTNLAMAYSDRLKQRILNLKNPTNDFKRIVDDLEKLKYDILNNGRKNNDLTTILRNMNEQIRKQSENIDDLEKVKDDARNISDNMAQLEQKVKDLNITAQYELIKTFQKYLNLTSGDEIRRLMDQVTLTRLELQNIQLNFTHFDIVKQTNDEKFRNTEDNLKSVESKIQSLKNRVQFAKEVAHSIDVGLSISNCRRRYKIDADVFTTLIIKYKCRNCDLVNLTNSQGQFIVVNVKNNQIMLNWNGELRTMAASSKTTTVTIERIGSIITLNKNDETNEIEPIFAKELLKLDNNNRIEIGGLSNTNEKSDACIQKVVLNGQVIGFWNFAESEGSCPGCQLETTSIVGENVLFNGNGYSNVTGARRMNPASVDLQFDITTFDENSLLFLAQDKGDPCSYWAIILNNGHIELLVRHIDGTNTTLTSKKTYNNGIKTNIVIELNYDHNENEQSYMLSVTQSGENDEINGRQPLKISSVFKIRKSEIFFGGIPSIVNKTCLPFNTTSYLGYLNPGNHEYSDLDRTISYNTKRQNGQLQFTKAWFPGDGFLELQPQSEYDLPINISFLLRPIVSTGFVMSLNNMVDLFIKSDKLIVKVDDEKHIIDVNLNKDINFVELSFNDDDELIASVNDVKKTIDFDQFLPKKLQLYLGNDPRRRYPSFSGGISNIVINKKTIQFNADTVKKFKQVEIGRSRPIRAPLITVKSSIGSIETNSIRDIQNTQGCPLIANYETDPDAVKFGDKPESFIFIENSFWRKDYVIEFQFRTFYPNGLLLLSTGGNQQKHYNLLEIQEGKVRLVMKGKRSKTVLFPNKVNDGIWHYVQIKQVGMKKKRRLTFTLDGIMKKPLRMPRNNVKNELYIGGTPVGFIRNNELENLLHPFRGCMRSLKINNILQTLVRNQKSVIYNNIGQCFPNVEEGAYFGGDAYAIYQADFKVNKVLELSLEFRTAEQNGILLSVSNPGNSPALSVELQNGAVVMTIDKGNGVISHVRNNLKSDFTLCDNRWHNITAMYSSFELTVKVDGIRRSWAQHDELMDEIEAPLYIGGIPDNAPTGTLKIKENFKGCIHKLKIENRLLDWTDMKELNNVLLNSCPVIGT